MRRMFTRPAAKPAATLFGTLRCDGEFSAKKPIAATIRLMPEDGEEGDLDRRLHFGCGRFPGWRLAERQSIWIEPAVCRYREVATQGNPRKRERVLRDHFCIRGARRYLQVRHTV